MKTAPLADLRAGRVSRIGPMVSLAIVVLFFIALSMAGIGAVLIEASRHRVADEQRFVYDWAQAELARDRVLLSFVCENRDYDAEWFEELHKADPPELYRLREPVFAQRRRRAAERRKECTAILKELR